MLEESLSAWLGSGTVCWGWTLVESDVFSMLKIRLCNWAAWGFCIAVAAGRIGTVLILSVTTKI